ncbi:MAG: thiol-disulfide isomerase/thioredoxin [Myxococcota bacterium]|jgi:thiol-disulfide isomerase/thioredoxin
MNFRSVFWIKARKIAMFAMAGGFAVIWLMKSFGGPPSDRLPQGVPVPAAKLVWLSGGEGILNPAELKGKAVLINFWATWCGACREEIGVLKKLHERYGGDDFMVVGITEEPPARVRAFVDQHDVTYPIVRDPGGRFSNRFNVRSIPFFIFVDANGKVVGDVTGPMGADYASERIEAILPSKDGAKGG